MIVFDMIYYVDLSYCSILEQDISMVHQHLKSPRSLSGTYIHPPHHGQTKVMIMVICFFFVSHQSDQQFLRHSYLEIWLWKIQRQGHGSGQGQGHLVHPVSNTCTSFLFHVNRTRLTIPEIWLIECLTLKNTSEILGKKNYKKKVSNSISLKI